MGWTSGFNETRDAEIADIIRERHGSDRIYRTLEHKVTRAAHGEASHILWTLNENEWLTDSYDGRRKKGEKDTFVSCHLLGREHPSRGGYWGHKSMSEDMGPGEFSCPLSFLRKSEGFSDDSSQWWREQVRAFHAAKKAKTPFECEPWLEWRERKAAQRELFAA